MILQGDCLELMPTLPAESVDAVVTDPPYGLEFMGKEWDSLRPGVNRGGAAPGRSERQADKLAPVEYGGARTRTSFECDGCGKKDKFQNPHGCKEPTWTRIYLQPNHGGYGRAMQAWHEAWATEAFRVLKPGGYLLAFGGTRTVHRLASAIEDAGFEIRDELVWIYASGFPKSLDVGKAMDRAAGVTERPIIGEKLGADRLRNQAKDGERDGEGRWGDEVGRDPFIRGAVTDLARQWDGWGTALKPAHEPIVMARKPLQGTVAGNVARWGTGAINVDGTRIGTEPMPQLPGELGAHGIYGRMERRPVTGPTAKMGAWEPDENLCASCAVDAASQEKRGAPAIRVSTTPKPAEVWPSEPDGKADTSASPATSASHGSETTERSSTSSSTGKSGRTPTDPSRPDTSSTTSMGTSPTTGSRTCRSCGATSTATTTTADTTSTPSDPPKPTTSGEALSVGRWPSNILLSDPELFDQPNPYVVGSGATATSGSRTGEYDGSGAWSGPFGPVGRDIEGDSGGYSRFFIIPKASRVERERGLVDSEKRQRANHHPTVKPVNLMRHLVRLVTPPGGLVLDPFLGSGTTAIACELEGFQWIGMEREAEYVAIAEGRIGAVTSEPRKLELGL